MLNLFDHFDKQIEMPYLDLSYAPPFAPVWDPVLVAVNAAREA